MQLSGNTILVTGGGTGIGRGLAEALHAHGNRVIIAGRRGSLLAEVAAANPGMAWIELDIADAQNIVAAVAALIAEYPALNVLINSAGIQRLETNDGPIDDELLTATVATNLLGPVRLSSALIPHFRALDSATIVHVSSMLAYLPLAAVSVYCATKAALHSFVMSQRYTLRDTSIEVLEIAPPYVQTPLLNGESDPRAMPLDQFIAETMEVLATDAQEVLVPIAKARRDALRQDEVAKMTAFNAMMADI